MKLGDLVTVTPILAMTPGIIPASARVVALELNHVLLEYPGTENVWGGPQRSWHPRAIFEPRYLILSDARQS